MDTFSLLISAFLAAFIGVALGNIVEVLSERWQRDKEEAMKKEISFYELLNDLRQQHAAEINEGNDK